MYELHVQSSILYRLLLRLRIRATATVQLRGKCRLQTAGTRILDTSVKIEPRILHMYDELFEYWFALYRLLGAAAAACSLYSYSGGASLASDHQAFTPRGDASA